MERRVVVAAVLSVLVLLAWSWMFPPQKPAPQIAQAEATRDASGTAFDPTAGDSGMDVPSGDPVDLDDQGEPAAAAIAGAARRDVNVETDLFRVVLTNDGARARSWELLEYTTNGGQALELLPHFTDSQPEFLALETPDRVLTTQLNEAVYQVETQTLSNGRDRAQQVRFSWADGRGLDATKTLTFVQGSYLVDIDVRVTDRGRPVPVWIALGPGFGAQEPSDLKSTYYYDSQALFNGGGRVRRLKKSKLTGEAGSVAATLKWAGMEDQYFTMLVLPGNDPTDVRWASSEKVRVQLGETDDDREIGTEPVLAVGLPSGTAKLYVGPKKYTLLRDLGHEMDRAVWFATNPFLAWIARFIFLCLIWIHAHTIDNYGVAIILSTFLLRVLLFPVNQYSMVSMKKTQLQMSKLQPKIKAIKNKYKKQKDAESRNKMNQETMEMYRAEGVNPMGGLSGCLPMLAQFPILIGFYNMLTVAVELRGAPFFGWITDLSQADPWKVIPILMGATMFLQQRMAMSKIKDPVQQQQQRFMMFMPVVFTFICLQMPSGMVLYWFMNNLLGMGQQYLVNRHTSRLETAAQKA